MIEKSVRKPDGPTELGPLRCITLDMLPKLENQPEPVYIPKSVRAPKVPLKYWEKKPREYSPIKSVKISEKPKTLSTSRQKKRTRVIEFGNDQLRDWNTVRHFDISLLYKDLEKGLNELDVRKFQQVFGKRFFAVSDHEIDLQ